MLHQSTTSDNNSFISISQITFKLR